MSHKIKGLSREELAAHINREKKWMNKHPNKFMKEMANDLDKSGKELKSSVAIQRYVDHLSNVATSQKSINREQCKCWKCVHVHLKLFPPYLDYGASCNVGATFSAYIMYYDQLWTDLEKGISLDKKALKKWYSKKSEPKISKTLTSIQKFHYLCGNCVSQIFLHQIDSLIHASNVINIHYTLKSTKPHWSEFSFYVLLSNILHFIPIYSKKLLNNHEWFKWFCCLWFQVINDSHHFVDIDRSIEQYNNGTIVVIPWEYRVLIDITNAFLLSIKFWKTKQLEIFLEEYGFEIIDEKLRNRKLVNLHIRNITLVKTGIMWKAAKYRKRMKLKKCNIVFKSMKNYKIVKRKWKKERRRICIENRENYIDCMNEKCKKKNVKLRLCKQCKMVYYCSRKCQKHHWKYLHKYQCKNMQQL